VLLLIFTRALASLATFYITLSFIASYIGMNVSQISSQNPISIWVYFNTAIPLSIISFAVVGKEENVMRGWSIVQDSAHAM
jgi:Mg2+ and Co2+ transporter CorA